MLASCSSLDIPTGFEYSVIQTSTFRIATWQRIKSSTGVYKIYIEGDGYAFNSKGKASSDPTPRSNLVQELTFNDKNENVAYLARPCQFVKSDLCEKKYWTTARFSKEVIDSSAEAIKQIVGDNPVILVGYSGGAQIAGLVAVGNYDVNVIKVITIAGNLDHKTWTEYHNLPSLTGSMNIKGNKAFDKIPQTHYSGARDEVIPPLLTQKAVADSSKIIIVPNADHSEGWVDFFNPL